MADIDYQKAYERQKIARGRAENLLEDLSRDLYETNTKLKGAYEKLRDQKSQLLHQEKLASVGQLSAGIAHEINNPAGFIKSNLTSLKNYTKTLLNLMDFQQKIIKQYTAIELPTMSHVADQINQANEDADLDFLIDDMQQLIDESIDGAKRIADIVSELKLFSRPDSGKKETLDVNQCIQSTVKLVKNDIKYKADLILDLGDIPKTLGYPGSLNQVILNFIVNASHAIDDFGEITVSTKKNADKIIIEVKDNGCGMEQEVINNIFDPFFTTKDVGVGTGLGLSISTGIIKKHEGEINVESTVGEGSCFQIVLPILEPENG